MIGGSHIESDIQRRIVLHELGTVKIADFGLSKSLKLNKAGDPGDTTPEGSRQGTAAPDDSAQPRHQQQKKHAHSYKLTGETGSYRCVCRLCPGVSDLVVFFLSAVFTCFWQVQCMSVSESKHSVSAVCMSAGWRMFTWPNLISQRRYMAPEVFRHELYNHKVDQYAFAMICYQLFQGMPPFFSLDPVQAARAAAQHAARPEWSSFNR